MTAARFDTLGRRIPPPGWHKYHRPTGPLPPLPGAACRGHNPDLWQPDNSPGGHPRDQAVTATAIAICRTCPIQAECLQHALAHNEFGIWGGTTDIERKELKDQQQLNGRQEKR